MALEIYMGSLDVYWWFYSLFGYNSRRLRASNPWYVSQNTYEWCSTTKIEALFICHFSKSTTYNVSTNEITVETLNFEMVIVSTFDFLDPSWKNILLPSGYLLNVNK